MKNFKVYQLPVEHAAKFMDLEFVNEHNIMPKLEDYKLVWEGEVEDSASLDNIFTKFNVGQKPEGYTGHSLSTSDVVEVDGKYFYCDDYGWKEVFGQKKAYIVVAYGSCNYKAKFDTREEALAKANELNDEYYQHKIWNVEEIVDEDVLEEKVRTEEHEITLSYHNIHFAQNGELLSGNIKIGKWEKEVLGGRDASGNKLVPYLYWISLNGTPSYSHIPFYTRKEVKKTLDCKTVKVQLPI